MDNEFPTQDDCSAFTTQLTIQGSLNLAKRLRLPMFSALASPFGQMVNVLPLNTRARDIKMYRQHILSTLLSQSALNAVTVTEAPIFGGYKN